ncbi:MAG: phosphate propanoyltransferase [Clostridia bacterium]|nr:phosphate propanoyltransferase [Clostridia bacterium]
MDLTVNDCRIETSARHVHLSEKDFHVLFGNDAQLQVVKPLSINGEFKSDKVVTIIGPKRNLERVAVLGPLRSQTQVEISVTDSYTLGIKNVPVRLSGNLSHSAPVSLIGTCGQLDLAEGLIVAQRHIHVNSSDMQKLGLTDGQKISISVGESCKITFHDVVVRKSNVDFPTVHLDTDEANAIH